MAKDYESREWMMDKYVTRGLSCAACGRLATPPVTAMVIHKWLRRHGIETRRQGEHMKRETNWRLGKPLDEATKSKIRHANTGRSRTEESKAKQAASVTGAKNSSFGKPRQHGKTIWVALPDESQIAMRSRWEISFADWLSRQSKAWRYEPETFILYNGSAYTPDFLCEGTYYEVKGYMQVKDEIKIAGFRQSFPQHTLIIVDEAFCKANGIPIGANCLTLLTHLQVTEREKHVCPICGESFAPARKSSVYCSRSCNARKPKKDIMFILCEVCGESVKIYPSQATTRRTCGNRCACILRGREHAGSLHWNYQGKD